MTMDIQYTLFLLCIFKADLASEIGTPKERTPLLDGQREFHWDTEKLLRHAHFITFSSLVPTKS